VLFRSTKPGLPPEQRLRKLELGLSRLLREYEPDVMAVENLYFFKNLKTAIPVSEAKGVVLLTAAKKKIRVWQFAPLEVKMGICGYGRADKTQVQRMIKEILNLKEIPKPDDAADALAIAVCYAFKNPKGG
ncbi:crossover junction endodeoxyribonuclease RuvC, partial [Patescibacteria group bacterium]|nr:crossover junction endodeoxyribonuclease RuvC [Patescibacteria group bacterium]